MPKGDAIYNPDVQSDIDMKSTWKLVNYPGSILPSIPVSRTVFVDVNGNDTTAAAGDLYHPAQTITKAITLASSLTPTSSSPVLIKVGPGTFTENSGVALPNYVSLEGSGRVSTFIQSSLGSVGNCASIINPGNYSQLCNFTVTSTATVGQNAFPVGAGSPGTAFTGVILRNIEVIGDSDAIYIHVTAGASDLKAYDCIIKSKWDTTYIPSGSTAEFYNCESIAIGQTPIGAGDPTHGINGTGGVIRWFGGVIQAQGSTAPGISNIGINAVGGTVEVYDAKLIRPAGGTNWDLQALSGGTILYSGVTKSDGTALTTSSFSTGTITELSRYVTKDNNLSEVANTTPTWTNNHTWASNGVANLRTLLLTNTAAATNGTTSQPSPILQLHGSGWHTIAGGASDTLDCQIVLVPFSASSSARARLTFSMQENGGGYTDLLALFESGGMSLGTDTDPGPNKFNALSGIYVNGLPVLTPTGLKLVHESNATAETDTFFYSTDSSGLAYKDAFGVVHPITGAGTSATIQSTLLPLKGDNTGNAIAATVTGTGNVVLDTSPTLVTPTIGVATATSVNKWTLTAPSTAATLTAGADGLTYTLPEITTKIGFRHIPQNSQSASYTTVLNDSGKHIYHPAADANNRTITIDSNANVAYPIGTAIMFVNMSANNLSIAITADTMYLAGTGTTGTRTLAQYGKATAVKTGTTEWVIAGVGLS